MARARQKQTRQPQMSTSVECGGVINVCGDEGRLGLSANSIVPHPPDATLKEIFSVKTTGTHPGSERGTAQVRRGELNLTVRCRAATLAAGVAAV